MMTKLRAWIVHEPLWAVAIAFSIGFAARGVVPIPALSWVNPPRDYRGPYQVSIVYESEAQPLPLQTHDLRDRLPGHTVLVVDDDVVNSEGDTPFYLRETIRAAREAGLPAVVIVDALDKIVHVGPLPATTEEIARLVPDHS